MTPTYNHSRALPNRDNPMSTTTADDKRGNTNSANNLLRQRTQSDLGTDNKQLRRRYKPFTLSTQNRHFKDDDNQKGTTNHGRSRSGSALERLSQRRAQYHENVDLEKSLSPTIDDTHNENLALTQRSLTSPDKNVTDDEDDHQDQDQSQQNEKETIPSLLGLSPIKLENDIDLYKSDQVQEQLNPAQSNGVHYEDTTHEIEDDHPLSSFNLNGNDNIDLSPVRDDDNDKLPKPPSEVEPSFPSSQSNIDSVDYSHIPPKLPSSSPPLIPLQHEERSQISNTNVITENQNPNKTDSPVNISVRNDIVSPLSPSSQLSSSSPFRSSVSPFSDSSQDYQKFSIDKPLTQWAPSDVGNWLTSVGLDAMKRRFTSKFKVAIIQLWIKYRLIRS